MKASLGMQQSCLCFERLHATRYTLIDVVCSDIVVRS